MVKFISLAAIVLPAFLSVVQAGTFVLNSGQLKGQHTIKKITCGGSTEFYLAQQPLKAGAVYCSYLPTVDMSLCQCHQADVSAATLNQFTGDILREIIILGVCSDKKGGVNYASTGTWLNGRYSGDKYMSAATFSNGKVSINTCKPVSCSHASKGLSWRNFQGVPAKC